MTFGIRLYGCVQIRPSLFHCGPNTWVERTDLPRNLFCLDGRLYRATPPCLILGSPSLLTPPLRIQGWAMISEVTTLPATRVTKIPELESQNKRILSQMVPLFEGVLLEDRKILLEIPAQVASRVTFLKSWHRATSGLSCSPLWRHPRRTAATGCL